ncbi:hypothetical protein [Streptomyces sp. NPDC003717]|uniref:hypothetical protein n=1 Tax=Streptomyces sp. NPDC003717 TaxID=3154276 RepID=UPI0033A5D31F
MGYSLGIYRFLDGELAEPDMDVVRAVLAPVRARPEPADDRDTAYWIRAGDGSEAEVDVHEKVVCVHRPGVGDVWKTIIELTDRLGAAIDLPSGGFLCPEGMRAHLPEGTEEDSVFVPAITLAAFERAAGPFTHPLT